MTAALEGVKLGDKLYRYDRRRSTYREFEVLKLGRKWITLSGDYRCTIDTLQLEVFNSLEQLYRSIEEHQSQAILAAAWNDFRRDVSSIWSRPEGLTVADINAMRAKIGLQVLEIEQDGKEPA